MFSRLPAKQRLLAQTQTSNYEPERFRQNKHKRSSQVQPREKSDPRNTAKKRMMHDVEASSSSKRKRRSSSDPVADEPPELMDSDDDFENNVKTLYLKNKLSAKDTANLVRSAHKRGAEGLDAFKTIGKKQPKNAQRDLMRKFTRGSTLPKPYFANVPIKDRKTGDKAMVILPFLLVSELLVHIMFSFGTGFRDILEDPPGSGFANMKRQWRADNNIPADDLVASLGMHGDGVSLGKQGSINVISWNITSMEGGERNMFTAIEKRDLCDCGCFGRCTLDSIMEIFRWDLMALYTGLWHTERHDGSAWLDTDKDRKTKKGKMGIRGQLQQCRGDWPWFKWLFGFKGWQSNDQICWRCRANKSSIPYWHASKKAKWMKYRLSQRDFANLIVENGFAMSPLFSIPGFDFYNICIDSLHAMDLGFTQEICGNIFWECLGIYAVGKNKKQQIGDFVMKLKAHYKRMKTPNCISTVTLDMLKKDGKAPKLRARGAETRYVVPFALEIAVAVHAEIQSEHTHNVLMCVSALMDFYMTFGVRPFPKDDAKIACLNAAHYYVLLAEEASSEDKRAWVIKPKLHIFMEMGMFQVDELGDPMTYWAYRDETFVGLVSDIGEARGGPSDAATAPLRIIERLRALSR